MDVYSLEKNDVQSVSLFLVPLTDQGQNQYLREASEVWERESKEVGFNAPEQQNYMQNTWNRLWCRNSA